MRNFVTLCYPFCFALLVSFSSSAQYCVPPHYLSGPFTGIIHVGLEDIDNTSAGTDGYSDFTSDTGMIRIGSSYDIEVEMEHTILNGGFFTDSLDLRVWIDWNQDEDFDDAGEEVVNRKVDLSVSSGQYNSESFTTSFAVPSGASVGYTRMRVYEDMLEADGHNPPTPCGYSSGIGQHGEAEDYTVWVRPDATGLESIEESALAFYPNPANDHIRVDRSLHNSALEIFDVLGNRIIRVPAEEDVIDVSGLGDGIYLIHEVSNERIHKLVVRH